MLPARAVRQAGGGVDAVPLRLHASAGSEDVMFTLPATARKSHSRHTEPEKRGGICGEGAVRGKDVLVLSKSHHVGPVLVEVSDLQV